MNWFCFHRKRPAWAVLGSITAVWFLSGCQSSTSLTTRPFELEPGASAEVREDLPIIWQQTGLYSRVSRKLRVVARDVATLARVPITEVPVDFRTQMVLIAAQGPTPGNEIGIRIIRVWRTGSRICVQEQPLHPGLQQGENGLDPASPWTVVVVPRSDLNVEGYETRVPGGALSDRLRPW